MREASVEIFPMKRSVTLKSWQHTNVVSIPSIAGMSRLEQTIPLHCMEKLPPGLQDCTTTVDIAELSHPEVHRPGDLHAVDESMHLVLC